MTAILPDDAIGDVVREAWAESPVRVLLAIVGTVVAVGVIWILVVFAIVSGTPQ